MFDVKMYGLFLSGSIFFHQAGRVEWVNLNDGVISIYTIPHLQFFPLHTNVGRKTNFRENTRILDSIAKFNRSPPE